MFRFFKNFFKKPIYTPVRVCHYTIVSKKDKRERCRFSFYKNGKLVKKEMTIEFFTEEPIVDIHDGKIDETRIYDGKRKIVC